MNKKRGNQTLAGEADSYVEAVLMRVRVGKFFVHWSLATIWLLVGVLTAAFLNANGAVVPSGFGTVVRWWSLGHLFFALHGDVLLAVGVTRADWQLRAKIMAVAEVVRP